MIVNLWQQRVPNLRLATDELDWKPGLLVRSFLSLPVSF
jgi:hypothetical protein